MCLSLKYLSDGSNIMMFNKSFEHMAEFKYLGVTLTNQSCRHVTFKTIKFRECLLPFSSEYLSFLSNNIKIKTYTTVTLPVIRDGCEWGPYNKGRTKAEGVSE
jgi:hypothetical protein